MTEILDEKSKTCVQDVSRYALSADILNMVKSFSTSTLPTNKAAERFQQQISQYVRAQG